MVAVTEAVAAAAIGRQEAWLVVAAAARVGSDIARDRRVISMGVARSDGMDRVWINTVHASLERVIAPSLAVAAARVPRDKSRFVR